jgi:hypothetical protein
MWRIYWKKLRDFKLWYYFQSSGGLTCDIIFYQWGVKVKLTWTCMPVITYVFAHLKAYPEQDEKETYHIHIQEIVPFFPPFWFNENISC